MACAAERTLTSILRSMLECRTDSLRLRTVSASFSLMLGFNSKTAVTRVLRSQMLNQSICPLQLVCQHHHRHCSHCAHPHRPLTASYHELIAALCRGLDVRIVLH